MVDGGGWALVAGPAQPRWEMWSEQRTEDQPPLAPSISPGEVAASTIASQQTTNQENVDTTLGKNI